MQFRILGKQRKMELHRTHTKTHNFLWKSLLQFCALYLIAQAAYARSFEADSTNHHEWVNLEFGGTAIGTAVGMVFSDYNTDNNNLISLRGMISVPVSGKYYLDFNTIKSPDDYFWDAGLMFGKGLQGRYYFLSLSGGIGLAGGVKRSNNVQPTSSGFDSIDESFTTIGIPIQAQVHLIPIRFIGFGLEGIANVNSKYSTWGVMVSLQIGGLLF
jgi:hypothetical protein